jgi:murein L,D-transpeptidase YcbB/YkuD
MRKSTIELLAGTALVIAIIQPGFATPTVRSVAPPPAAIPGYEHRRPAPRATMQPVVPVPQPRQDDAQGQSRETQHDRVQERAQERIQERHKIEAPAVAAPLPAAAPDKAHAQVPAAPAPEPVAESKGIDLKAALDKLLAASDSSISEKLRGFATTKQFDKMIPHQPERGAAEAFYKSRNYAPVWIKEGQLTPRAKAAILRLKNAAADGLDPADYQVPEFGTFTSAEALAEGDVALTKSVLDYARHLATGRIAPTRVSAEVDYGNHTPDPAAVLREVTSASDVSSTFESYNPPHPGFKALKNQLAALRSNASADVVPADRIPDGPMLRLGMKDSRVPMLREKLKVRAPKNPADTTYDKELAKAVYYLQKHAKLRADGNLDNKTLAALNGPPPMPTSKKIDTIVANMERWRWLPRNLGKQYVMVNIPDYTLKVVKDGDVTWRTKIVAGKPQTPTPLLTAAMDNVVVNPSWYVPQSIIQNELLPLYDSDPRIFERMGLEVRRGPDGHINVVQPPGAANALGHIKFNFPNKFQVYLHDTPEKRLFAQERRAFSHGCMRVEDPTKFGEVVLAMAMAGPTPDSRTISSMYGKDEKTFKLASRPMVHLTYQTAYVDDDGKLVIREDLYGFDSRIHTILTTDERKVADVAPPQDPKRDLATLKSNQEILRRVERREAGNPLVFFERLFR